MHETLIGIEVAWALPDDQTIVALRVPAGCTAAQAVARVAHQLPNAVSEQDLGVFGRRVASDHVLQNGDRVELYRPLKADPKDIRRELARLASEAREGASRS
jgi:putative ubiquitin-RnfH superfamily antitoxin RatB of RatAB toxin-antitoxin module